MKTYECPFCDGVGEVSVPKDSPRVVELGLKPEGRSKYVSVPCEKCKGKGRLAY